MTSNLDSISRLLYNHVNVVTTIKRTDDFQCPFASLHNQMLIYSGYLKVIDPLTKSTILCSIDSQKRIVTNNLFILGHTISEIQLSDIASRTAALDVQDVQHIIETDTATKTLSIPYFKRVLLDEEELNQRRQEIFDWLKKNRIPVDLNPMNNEIEIAKSVRIRAPYEHESDYICPTRIVLSRIKSIVDSRRVGSLKFCKS